jgi:hypothetical protein
MIFEYWIINATNVHLEYVILTAFPLQQYLLESASMLHYMYVACLFIIVRRAVYITNENLLETWNIVVHSLFAAKVSLIRHYRKTERLYM